MFSKDDAKSLAKMAVELARPNSSEVVISFEDSLSSRFAGNEIHQSVARQRLEIDISVRIGSGIGMSTTNCSDETSLRECIDRAAAVARAAQNSEVSLPLSGPFKVDEGDSYFESTARHSPEMKAAIISKVVEKAKKSNLTASGNFSTNIMVVAYANSVGSFFADRSTMAHFSLTFGNGKGLGWSSLAGHDIDSMDFDSVVDGAHRKAISARESIEIPPGEYTVVLEPHCVAKFLKFMQVHSFSGMSAYLGTSFLKDKVGKRVFGDNITIVDDWSHPVLHGIPFDLQGVPRKKVVLVEDGVLKNFVHDKFSAMKMKEESTGHGLMEPNSYGAIPFNLVMKGGDSTLDEMIKNTEKGILVTRFHYCNLIDHSRMMVTGMTRDGTFLIENGVVTSPVKNLRFTQSIVDTFSNVIDMTKDISLAIDTGSSILGAVVPSIRVKNFRFTSSTES